MRSRTAVHRAAVVTAGCVALGAIPPAAADEGGAGFWVTGQMGSFSAVPSTPGFSVPVMAYHASFSAGGEKSFVLGGNRVAGIDAQADLAFLVPTYTFATPVAGGQAAISMGWGFGRMSVDVDAVLTRRDGQQVEARRSDATTGGSDLYPMATLKWHDGVHNTMVYVTGAIPVGAYQVGRLANVGLNHVSVDAGGGYTYLNAAKGAEFSVVAGLTYNFENEDTDYRNGVDAHLDWAASTFLNDQFHVGLAGYAYQQVTGDSGAGAVLGDHKARVFGIGPQAGYFFPVGKEKGYVNLRGYYEFGAQNRPEGWSLFLSLALPLGAGP